jgi:hypothetical protein
MQLSGNHLFHNGGLLVHRRVKQYAKNSTTYKSVFFCGGNKVKFIKDNCELNYLMPRLQV